MSAFIKEKDYHINKRQKKKGKMIQIDDKIISLELFQNKFLCNIAKCHGICCVEEGPKRRCNKRKGKKKQVKDAKKSICKGVHVEAGLKRRFKKK